MTLRGLLANLLGVIKLVSAVGLLYIDIDCVFLLLLFLFGIWRIGIPFLFFSASLYLHVNRGLVPFLTALLLLARVPLRAGLLLSALWFLPHDDWTGVFDLLNLVNELILAIFELDSSVFETRSEFSDGVFLSYNLFFVFVQILLELVDLILHLKHLLISILLVVGEAAAYLALLFALVHPVVSFLFQLPDHFV